MTHFILLLLHFSFAHAGFCEDQMAEQQLRIDVASTNIKNSDTTRTPEGGPFRPLRVVCGLGPCSEISDPNFSLRYLPNHPDANENGYVQVPNINVDQQMKDLKIAQARFIVIRQQCD